MLRLLKISNVRYYHTAGSRLLQKVAENPLPSTDEAAKFTTNPEANLSQTNAPHAENASEHVVPVQTGSKLPSSEELRCAASFDDVPGPEFLKRVAKAWSYVPLFGNHMTARSLQYMLSAGKIFGSQLSWVNNMVIFRYLLNEYGPIVRLRGPFGGDVVILSRPEHATAVFDSDGPFPVRSSLNCIEKYRLHHRKYKNAGPFVMHGPEWDALRKNIEPALKLSVEHQCQRISKTADDFLLRVVAIRNQQLEVPKTFLTELQKWSIECLCSITFNKSFGFLDARGLSATSDNALFLNAITNATTAIKRCEFGFFHVWKYIDTPAWRKLVQHCDTIDHILGSNIRKAEQSLSDRQEKGNINEKDICLVDYFLLKESMSNDDMLTILLDMSLLGVNMTAYSAGFLLYHLAKNQRSQFKLYNEVKDLPTVITRDNLKDLTFLKACLYESLRLKPPMPILSRILNKDVRIYGYKIPKGTFVLIATNLSSLREEHFEDPLKFKPERWLGLENNKEMNSFATIPFGHGPKNCLAKEMAETQIYYLIAKLVRKFRIEYHYGDIDSNNKLLSAPSRPFKFRFVERD